MNEEKNIDNNENVNKNMACDLVLSKVKLSSLQKGQYFKFKSGQVAKYVMKPNNLCDLDTNDWSEFEVIKVNKTSIKCRVKNGCLEYTFKFKGFTQTVDAGKNIDNISGKDCLVMII